MKIGMRVTGADRARVELRHNADRVRDNARGFMRRSADRIVEEAKILAPRDLYNLEEAIHIEKDYGTSGRLEIDIVAGGTVNGVNVDEYAAIIHENYEQIIVEDGNPERRQGTKEKQMQHPDKVIGSKFLERAAKAEEKGLAQRMLTAVLAGIRRR